MRVHESFIFALRAILFLGFATAIAIAWWAPTTFETRFATEDGPIEYATVVFLLLAAACLVRLARHVTGSRVWILSLYALVFFWAAGEEVSWGQRLFHIESPEFFLENNFQGETNLHNLVIGDTHLTEVVFGTGLAIVIMLYLLVLPWLYERSTLIACWSDRLCIPVPEKHIGVLALISVLISEWIGLQRQWEVFEYAFSVIICLVFLSPLNRHAFSDTSATSDWQRCRFENGPQCKA